MTRTKKALRRLYAGAGVASLAALILASSTEPAAQIRNEQQPTVSPVPHDFVGNWFWDTPRQSCGALVDSYGEPLQLNGGHLCQWPYDRLEQALNGRGRAWLQLFSSDEAISPKWTCRTPSLNTNLTEYYKRSFQKRADSLVMFWEHDVRVRYIYTDGRPHPPAMDAFYHGHSIGWMEGETFVVETTNLTFNPDGYDDLGHMATSHMATITERYTLRDYDTMELAITVDDPVFLKEPFTFVGHLKRTVQPPVGSWDCDPEVAAAELYMTFDNPYPDDTTAEKYFGIE